MRLRAAGRIFSPKSPGIDEIDRRIERIGIAIDAIDEAQGVALGETPSSRIVVTGPVVDQPCIVRLPAGVAIVRNAAAAGGDIAPGVEALGDRAAGGIVDLQLGSKGDIATGRGGDPHPDGRGLDRVEADVDDLIGVAVDLRLLLPLALGVFGIDGQVTGPIDRGVEEVGGVQHHPVDHMTLREGHVDVARGVGDPDLGLTGVDLVAVDQQAGGLIGPGVGGGDGAAGFACEVDDRDGRPRIGQHATQKIGMVIAGLIEDSTAETGTQQWPVDAGSMAGNRARVAPAVGVFGMDLTAVVQVVGAVLSDASVVGAVGVAFAQRVGAGTADPGHPSERIVAVQGLLAAGAAGVAGPAHTGTGTVLDQVAGRIVEISGLWGRALADGFELMRGVVLVA